MQGTFVRIQAPGQTEPGILLPSEGPISLDAEGEHTLRFYAADRADNAEAVQTLTVRIDTTAPTLAFGSPAARAPRGNMPSEPNR